MKRRASGEETMLGVLRQEGERCWLQGIEKKERREFAVSDIGGAAAGDLVRAEKTGRGPRISAKVVERLGDPFEARNFSLIAVHLGAAEAVIHKEFHLSSADPKVVGDRKSTRLNSSH